MKTYAIATIPGDGIGKEVVPAGRQVLEALLEKYADVGLEHVEDEDAYRAVGRGRKSLWGRGASAAAGLAR